MLLKHIEQEILKGQKGEFIYPRYKDFCFSNIPSSVLYLFGQQKTSPLSGILDKAEVFPKKNQKIVLILLDAFGYTQWLKYAARYEFLNRLTKKGVLAPLTSVFPSTTSAALTTLFSGLTPQEHGLPEWRVYFEEIDKIAVTLPFAPFTEKGENCPDKLLEMGVNPKILFHGRTTFQTLAKAKIPCFTFTNKAYAHSAYSKTVQKGSAVVPFLHASDLIVNLRQKVNATPAPAFFSAYWAGVDSISHTYGPHSEQYLAELNWLCQMLQKEFMEKINKKQAQETVLLVTADHGQIERNPRDTIYLNQYPEVEGSFRHGKNGDAILPWGSHRNMMLAVKKEKLSSTFAFLTDLLKGKAAVMYTKDMIKQGLFGQDALHKKFKSRVGDIAIVSRGRNTVWYKHWKGEKNRHFGSHGGLSPEEMLVPFAAARMSDLL